MLMSKVVILSFVSIHARALKTPSSNKRSMISKTHSDVQRPSQVTDGELNSCNWSTSSRRITEIAVLSKQNDEKRAPPTQTRIPLLNNKYNELAKTKTNLPKLTAIIQILQKNGLKSSNSDPDCWHKVQNRAVEKQCPPSHHHSAQSIINEYM